MTILLKVKLRRKLSLGPSNAEVGDEALADVLIGIGVFQRAIVEILGCADECGERAIVESVRPGVIGIEGENVC